MDITRFYYVFLNIGYMQNTLFYNIYLIYKHKAIE